MNITPLKKEEKKTSNSTVIYSLQESLHKLYFKGKQRKRFCN